MKGCETEDPSFTCLHGELCRPSATAPRPTTPRRSSCLRNPVNNQIRIPPNRRSEMRIRGRRQRKVSLVLLRVPRLLQRPQHQVAQNPLFRLAFDPLPPASDTSWASLQCLRRPRDVRACLPLALRIPPIAARLHRVSPAALQAPANTRSSPPVSSNWTTRRASGFSWMRYSDGTPRSSSQVATHSFAASMNSSISRFAQVRSARVTPRIWPCSSNSITGSGKSKSIDPRSSRRLFISTASFFMRSKSSTRSAYCGPHLVVALRESPAPSCKSSAPPSELRPRRSRSFRCARSCPAA